MYTIIMNDNKQLVTTVKTNLYQREKLADKIQFLFPQTYEDVDITACTAVLKYMDPVNKPHTETLTQDEELYKEKVRFALPVDTDLTKYSGDIKVRITLTYVDLDTATQTVLHTGQTKITIVPLEDYFNFDPDVQLELVDQMAAKIDAKVQELTATAEYLQETKADSITRTDDGTTSTIQLTSNGDLIGTPVSLVQDEISSVDLDTSDPTDDNDEDVVVF